MDLGLFVFGFALLPPAASLPPAEPPLPRFAPVRPMVLVSQTWRSCGVLGEAEFPPNLQERA